MYLYHVIYAVVADYPVCLVGYRRLFQFHGVEVHTFELPAYCPEVVVGVDDGLGTHVVVDDG